MRYQLSLDVPYCDQIQNVLVRLRKHSAKIEDFDPVGPAGGNPCLLLSFETKEQALDLLEECYPDDETKFLEGRIRECNSS